MKKMTEQQWRAFVTHGTRTGKLSTVRADGSPHLTPADDMRRWGGLLGARYMGDDRAGEYAARNGGPGNLLIRGRIDKVTAFGGIAA